MLEKQKGSGDQLELSQTSEEVKHSTQSAFTSVKSLGRCCPRVLFEQDTQSQNPRQDPGRSLPDSRGNQPVQSEHYPIPRQECPSQRM